MKALNRYLPISARQANKAEGGKVFSFRILPM